MEVELQEVKKRRGVAAVAADLGAGETRARRGTGAAFTMTEAALKVSEPTIDTLQHFASSAPSRNRS